MYPEPKHSRGIFSRHDQFKIVVGPVFKLIEHSLFDGETTKKFFIKKVPAEKRAAFVWERLSGKGSETMATDYTAFESHFVEELMDACEFQLYDYMVQNLNCPDFKNFVGVIKGMNRIEFKNFAIKLNATRMSGEMNTSLGNSFANLMVFLYLQRNNKNVDCLVEGDDCLGVFDGTCPTSKDYSDLGLTVKIERPSSINTASFCGQVFSSDLTTLVDPHKFILKFNWSPALYVDASDKTLRELAHAKSMSALHSYPACPVVTAYAKYVFRTSGKYWKIDNSKSNWEKVRLEKLLREFQFEDKSITQESRFIVEELWGFTISQQIFLEELFDSLTSPGPLYEPILHAKATPMQRESYWRFVRYFPVAWATPSFWVFKFDGKSASKADKAKTTAPKTRRQGRSKNAPARRP